MSRADLLALTPDAVAALANLGLVKRALREIEAGKGPKLDEDAEGLVTGVFEEGVTTRVPPGVPLRDAACSCGATTVCRHRVAVVLAYRTWHEASRKSEPGEAATPVEAEDEPWSPSCFEDEALSALVGKRVFARAQALVRTGVVVELEPGAFPVAKLPTCAVKFHVRRDLAYARCDCRAAIACEHVVVAAWAFRRAGTDGATTIELGAERRSTTIEPALDDAMKLAEHVLGEGIVHLGEAEKARFARVRGSLATAGYLWPGTIVDDLEIAIEAYRARSARYRTSDVAFLLTSLAARTRASRGNGELPKRYVLGSDEARETALDQVRLVSLGARVFADGRQREANVYLADPGSGVVLVASRTFDYPEDAEPEEGPDLARRTITGRFTLAALARGQLVTRAAKRHANHALKLTTSRTAQSSIAPSSGDFGMLPSGLLVSDFGELADTLRARPPRLLRPRMLASQMRVLALGPDAVVKMAYRPADQEIVAILRDDRGADVRLVRTHARTAPHALDAIARALDGKAAPRFVAGDVKLGPYGIEIDPTSIVTDRIVVPDLEKDAAFVETLPTVALGAAPPFVSAVGGARAILEESLHTGLAHTRPGFHERALAAAASLGASGLEGARLRFVALAEAVKAHAETAASAWLDAAVRLELTHEATLLEEG